VVVGAFDEFSVLEAGAGADEGDEAEAVAEHGSTEQQAGTWLTLANLVIISAYVFRKIER
jgi:hypothetical protein